MSGRDKGAKQWWGLALALAMACGDDPLPGASASTTAGSGTGTGSTSQGSEGTADTAGAKLDVGLPTADGTTTDTGVQEGCDKVDFLFIIDNSGSMADEQANLISSFPLFIDTIQSTLDEAQDYHLMVLDVDPWIFERCGFACAPPPECLDPTGECNPVAAPICSDCLLEPVCASQGGFECGVTVPLPCEDVLGAGVTFPRGPQGSNVDCSFTSGARYVDASEPDVSAAFQCAAQVGAGSWSPDELPMEAMVQAVTPGTDAFACNEGFLRDDAILVVTFITDEDDAPGDSSGTAGVWKQALVSAKNGDESAIVVVGLFGDNDQPDGICEDLVGGEDGAEAAPRLRQFVESFGDRGFFGSVCAGSYDPFFQEAVALIDTTCDEFIPPVG
ncbi:MAG: hypothetical protein AB1Z98_22630 [Nannocystaceae bacterium]